MHSELGFSEGHSCTQVIFNWNLNTGLKLANTMRMNCIRSVELQYKYEIVLSL